MMRNTMITSLSSCSLIALLWTTMSNFAHASELSGIWKFEKSRTYGETAASIDAPPFSSFTLLNNKIIFSENCAADFSTQKYFFSDVFQSMSKAGIIEGSLEPFLSKEFNLPLSKTRTVFYLPSPARKCARPIIYFFYTDKHIIIPVGESFFSYTQAPDLLVAKKTLPQEIPKAVETVKGYKVTPLPMNFQDR